jgi:2-methylcitrate dehydratase PrpD
VINGNNPLDSTANNRKDYDPTIERWATHIANADFDNIDQRYIQHAKNRIIDIIGCMIGGVRSPGSDMVATLIQGWGAGERHSSIIGFGKNYIVPAHTAAMVGGILARSFDFGVLIPCVEGQFYEAHLSETSVPTALALSEAWHRSGKEMICALLVGDDIASRLIAASNYAAGLNWDSTGTVNRFGAAAVAGSIMRLSPDKMMNTFGIILDQLSGSFQSINDRVHSFKLTQGMSGRDGIVAAELAGIGWLGSRNPLYGKYGYFALFCSGEHDTHILTKDLGKIYYADSTFKPYPCCRQMHIFIDCALKIIQDNKDLSSKDIDTITVVTSSRVASGPLNAPFTVGEFPLGSAMFNIGYNVANVLLRKGVDLVHYTEEFINSPEIKDLTDKVSITQGAIRDEESLDLAEITARMKDGRELTGIVRYAKGHPLFKPLSQQEIEEKFMRNMAFGKIMATSRAEELLNMLKRLEEIDDVSKIVKFFSETQ